ncbi:MAG: DUF167 domain-containing protein [Bryobacteraceae bacterium]|nr:DUF167 domain-containing protein [Bryobacteraceae bacterium]
MEDLEELRARLRAEGVLVLAVKVIPRSPRTEFAGRMADGSWKVRVAAAPEKGRANAALLSFIAECLGARPGNVSILAGQSSQRKQLRIEI